MYSQPKLFYIFVSSIIFCLIPMAEAKSLNDLLSEATFERYRAPYKAINMIQEKESDIAAASDTHFFDANFLLSQLYFKVGQYEDARKVIYRIELRLSGKKAYLPWIALLKAQLMLNNQLLEKFDATIEPYYTTLNDDNRTLLNLWYLYMKGSALVRKNQFAEAMDILTRALSAAQKMEVYHIELGVRNQLVQLYYHTQKYQRALDMSDEMLAESRRLEDQFTQVSALANKMNVYYMLSIQAAGNSELVDVKSNEQYQNYAKLSAELQQQVIALARDIGAFRPEAWALILKQNQYLTSNEFRKALEVSQRTIELTNRYGLEYERAVSYNNQAIAYRYLSQFEESLAAIEKAEAYYRKTDNRQSLLWALEDYAITYELQGNTEKALQYYKKFHEASIALVNKSSDKKLLELQEQFSAQEKLQEIERLKQQAELNAKVMEAERMGRWLLIVIVAATLLIAITLYIKRKKLKTLLDQQAELTSEIKEMGDAKQRFFANLSHEFRTALTLSIAPLKKVLSSSDMSLQAAKGPLNSALENNLHIMSLLSEVFDVERMDSNSLPIRVRQFQVSKVINASVQRFQHKLIEKDVALTIHGMTDQLSLYFDPSHFEKIISNLLSNAIKYSASNQEIKLRLKHGDAGLEISVSDQGQGISATELPHVFKRFYQGRRSLDKSMPGTGIGLSMVKELMELHGGSVQIESEPNQGTQVRLYFRKGCEHYSDAVIKRSAPSSKECAENKLHEYTLSTTGEALEKPKLHKAEESIKTSADIEQRKVILVVDDNDDIRRLVREALLVNYHVVEADNGKTGLEMASAIQPDLIIADVMMPEMDGFQLTRNLRNNPQLAHISIMLLTALGETPHKVKGLEFGADDYLTKPFDNDELCARVKSHLAQKQRLSEVLFEKYKNSVGQQVSTHQLNSHDSQRCKQLEEVISSNLSRWEFDVEQMYTALNMTRSTLFRYTKKMYGCSPKNLLKKRRLEVAFRMLQQNSGTISEVAYAVGFQSLSTFSRAFREQYDYPPTKMHRV